MPAAITKLCTVRVVTLGVNLWGSFMSRAALSTQWTQCHCCEVSSLSAWT